MKSGLYAHYIADDLQVSLAKVSTKTGIAEDATLKLMWSLRCSHMQFALVQLTIQIYLNHYEQILSPCVLMIFYYNIPSRVFLDSNL